MEEIANSALPNDEQHFQSDRPTNEPERPYALHHKYQPSSDEQYENVRNVEDPQTKVPFNDTRIKRDLNMNEYEEESSQLVGQNGRQFNQYNRPFNSNQNRARQQNYEAQGRISFGFR